MWGGFGSSVGDRGVSPAGGLTAGPAIGRRRVRMRVGVAVGTLSVAVLAGLGTSVAAACPSEAEPSPLAQPEPIAPTSPLPTPPPNTTPPLNATPEPATGTTPIARANRSPRGETRDDQQPGAPTMGQPRPGGDSPGDPTPLRPDEPPAAAVLSEPAGSPGARPGVGPGPTPRSRPGGPFPPDAGSPPERVRLIVASAMVSGIAAVTGWLLLGGRRREQGKAGAAHPSGTTDAPGPGTDVDVERLLNAPDGARRDRRARRVPAAGPAPLWQAEDDRPRWVRRLDEQNPARPSVKRSAPLPDEEPNPWLESGPRSTATDGDEEIPR